MVGRLFLPLLLIELRVGLKAALRRLGVEELHLFFGRRHDSSPLIDCYRECFRLDRDAGKLHSWSFPNARRTRSGVKGASVKCTPIASAMALPTAAAPATIDGSPTIRAPYGPSSDGTSTMIASIGGRSRVVGIR